MKRAAIILGLTAFLCYSALAAPKQKPAPKPAIVATKRTIWRVLFIPVKYTFAGLLRLKLDSRAQPYE